MTPNLRYRLGPARHPPGRARCAVPLPAVAAVLVGALSYGCGKSPVEPEHPPDPAAVASVTIDYLGDSLVINGQTTSLAVTARDASGNTLSGRTVEWNSSNTAVAEVGGDDTGAVVTGRAAGTVSIAALVENVPGTTSVRVADTNVPALAEVAADLYGRAAAGRLQGGGTVLSDILDDIAAALGQKNLSAIRDGIRTARGALSAPTSPDDVVLYSVVGLFVGHIERLLNI